jgi:hypothetical protein
MLLDLKETCSLAQGLQQCYFEGEAGGRGVCLSAHGHAIPALCHTVILRDSSGELLVRPPSTSPPFYF